MQSGRPPFGPSSGTTKKRLLSLADTLSPENPHRERLSHLFREIEREFDQLYSENVCLQEKLDALLLARSNEIVSTPSVTAPSSTTTATTTPNTVEHVVRSDPLEVESAINASNSKSLKQKLSGTSTKLKTSHKIKAQTSKIVSSFKAHSVVRCP